MGDPPATVRMRQRINLKGVEYLVEEERDRGALVRHRRVFVHRLAGHAIGSGIALGSSAHEFVLNRAVEAVEGERVVHGGIAVAVAATALLQDVGRLGHRLHPAGHAQFGFADCDLTMGERNGVEA